MKAKFLITQKQKDNVIDSLREALKAQTKLSDEATANVATLKENMLSLKSEGIRIFLRFLISFVRSRMLLSGPGSML